MTKLCCFCNLAAETLS